MTVRKFYNDVIDQSLRVQNSHHLERTTSTGGNQSTWTFSAWIKIAMVQYNIFGLHIVEVMVQMSQHLDFANDKLNIYDSGATRGQVTTKACFVM